MREERRLLSAKNGNITISFVFQLNADWTQLEVIDLINDGTGLGFGIIGGRSTGVVVKTILPGGVADLVSNMWCVCEREIHPLEWLTGDFCVFV